MTREDELIRADFPLLKDNNLIYLDNTATSQKPKKVIDDVADFYRTLNSNPMRGLYDISVRATEMVEKTREKVASFINADSSSEIVFTRNATEGLNLVAYSYGDEKLLEGDEVIISIAEHHSNYLPWKRLCERKKAVLKIFECDENGVFSLEAFKAALSKKTKIVAMSAMSNVFGRDNKLTPFVEAAHECGAVFVADGAQSVPHVRTDVRESGVDFLSFSGHKMFSPMGIGVLYGKASLLKAMPPFLSGGEMIEYVHRDSERYSDPPYRFEAGTLNAGGVKGLLSALDYIESKGFSNITGREEELSEYMMKGISAIPHVKILGSGEGREHHGIFTFAVDGVHPHDISEIMSSRNICIRAGHHCAQPLHEFLGVRSTARASLGYYNTKDDIDAFLSTLSDIRSVMGYKD
ncbi:MAG: cysteine desulfurase [Lachnospiraceae bacterium]|nr:cysteine desulfurase [Lachnospiraceae bacterium]